ncbi:TPA: hypothetical protein HA241_04790 [Candidatus Woesearchaeota archaeon]|nr:hypothetical protein [Candidatus Woesearchaeota archaeon]
MAKHEKYHDEEEEIKEEETADETTVETSEEGFMKGYADEEEVEECAECGTAIREEKKAMREIEGEKYVFCSKNCADEFEESIGN